MLEAEYTVSRPRRLRLRTWLGLILVMLVVWSVASYWSDYREQSARRARENMAPVAGDYCTIVFASQAVGLERSGTRAAEINGTSNSISGTFVKMNDQWIVISTAESQRWIARDKVLFLELKDL
ncbi:MAG: hypothetical protein CMJ58_13315 [Planctomycetaceae bacterium]|nr:hypothetical protein [Planctomycetaceae bacterium]